MLTPEDLEAIRAIVREEIARDGEARRRKRPSTPAQVPPEVDEAMARRARELVRAAGLGRARKARRAR